MKVAAFVLLLAVAGLLVVGAVDAKKDKRPHEKPMLAIACADASAFANGDHFAATNTDTYTEASTGRCGASAESGSSSGSIAS
jgi:hypothetical protein